MPWKREDVEASAGRTSEDWHHAEDNVGCHLVVLYWRGKLSLEESDLLARFLEHAAPEAKRKAMWFVGSSLASHEGEVPRDILNRMMALWEWRMAVARQAPSEDSRQELACFGGWFAYGRMDPMWSARMLIEVLRLTDHVDHPAQVIARLAGMAAGEPGQAVECLKGFVTADRYGWRHSVAKEHVETILRFGLEADAPGVLEKAEELINLLAERGDLTYRSLRHNGLLTNITIPPTEPRND